VPNYVEFPTDEEGVMVLVEVDGEELQAPAVQKAGLFRKSGATSVVTATVNFDVAVRRVVGQNVRALTEAVKKLAIPPDHIELKFGLRATGEVGNLAMGKVGGDASIEVTLAWKTPDRFAGELTVTQTSDP
jgi:hypothetical protein